jgi:peroxiredoxin
MSPMLLGYLLPWCLLGVGGWLGYQLLRQNGRMLLRVEEMEQHLHQLTHALAAAPTPSAAVERADPEGLPFGSPAPEFALPDLAGHAATLAGFRGRRLLLIFFNPRCGFCSEMAADLAALPIAPDEGHPLPVLISTGEARENRKLVKEHGIPCPVLLQEQMEVAATYRANGTPMGYLIDADGKIESGLAVGSAALLELAASGEALGVRRWALGVDDPAVGPNAQRPTPNAQRSHKGNRALADSHLNRNGLAAGTMAPAFTLPLLEGGELSLESYRGREVLLVFSDPHCGPCNELAPRLEELHRRQEAIEVLMVSKGDAAANRAKAAEHGLTFPIALQRQWEVSRQYEMFATPIAFRIDAAGRIAATVAVGVEAILGLVPGGTPAVNGKREPAGSRRG